MTAHVPYLRLGINIDHVATIRNARGGQMPDPVQAALQAEAAGADGITAHLREDRRHIKDGDMLRLKEKLEIPLNMEMAATQEMLEIARQVKPHAVCLVPERRAEITTEGGLNVAAQQDELKNYITELKAIGARVSLFIDPDKTQVEAAQHVGADIVELHTGTYAENNGHNELEKIQKAAKYAHKLGLECHAGHGLNFANVSAISAIPEIEELNIGHFIIGQAIFLGLEETIHRMRFLMDRARYGSNAA